MAKVTIKHGAQLDVLTPAEARALVGDLRERSLPRRIRATAQGILDAAGNVIFDVYEIPVGWEFELRRVTLDLDAASSPGVGNRALNVAGQWVAYLRSGTRIEYANPQSSMGVSSIPGAQTWGAEQGPYFRNGEVLQVQGGNLGGGGVRMTAAIEGILRRPADDFQ